MFLDLFILLGIVFIGINIPFLLSPEQNFKNKVLIQSFLKDWKKIRESKLNEELDYHAKIGLIEDFSHKTGLNLKDVTTEMYRLLTYVAFVFWIISGLFLSSFLPFVLLLFVININNWWGYYSYLNFKTLETDMTAYKNNIIIGVICNVIIIVLYVVILVEHIIQKL